MRIAMTFPFLLLLHSGALGQLDQNARSSIHVPDHKPALDFEAVAQWPVLGNYIALSSDGRFCAYTIENSPHRHTTLVVQSTVNAWKRSFVDAQAGFFSEDGKRYVYVSGDTLHFLGFDKDAHEFIESIESYKHLQGRWLAYQVKDKVGLLQIRNLSTGEQFVARGVIAYDFDPTGQFVLLKTKNDHLCGFRVLHLESGQEMPIWTALDTTADLVNFSTDRTARQFAFILKDKHRRNSAHSIWYFKTGMTQPVMLADDRSPGVDSGLYIHNTVAFSDDGRYILFDLAKPPDSLPPASAGNPVVEVWSYHDTLLYSMQSQRLQQREPSLYAACIMPGMGNVVRVRYEGEAVLDMRGDFAVTRSASISDRFWEKRYREYGYWLISLKDGSRKRLASGTAYYSYYFSPSGKFLVWFSGKDSCNYFSCELASGRVAQISANVPAYLLGARDEFGPPEELPGDDIRTGVAGWLQDDAGVLVYDTYDIWLLDLRGKRHAVNVTNGYGRMHKIKLKLTWDTFETYPPDATLHLTAFDEQTKYNGFYRKQIGKKGNPGLLHMGPYTVHLGARGIQPFNTGSFGTGMPPLKASKADRWIVKRMSFDQAPNYFITSDFKVYKPLSDLQPQRKYRWLTAELIRFNQLDGTPSQGVLYKPENFDPSAKYPVIITYYEQLSHRLFQFPAPRYLSSAHLEVAWFASRGYLIFTPDIYFMNKEKRVVCAYEAVAGAARHLRGMPWVDSTAIGISGHSRAGGFTNYIITQTDLFAAALEGAGISDKIGDALQQQRGFDSKLEYVEEYYCNYVSIWEDTELWNAQSPILNLHRITTPLLIQHNRDDRSVNWQNAFELFQGMRRLGKKVWMLQYDGEGHVLGSPANMKDFTIRATQFFDHFLKKDWPPKWMTEGEPAREKGIGQKYELDAGGLKAKKH